MKNSRFLIIIGIALLPLLSGCPDRKDVVTTSINRDGSCARVIDGIDPKEYHFDDSIKNDFPIPIDGSWEVVAVTDSTGFLKKEFENIDELNNLYQDDESEYNMYKRRVELVKKFRWFHTVFQYSETYGGLLKEIPITNYMSEEEAQVFTKYDEPADHPMLAQLEEKSRKSYEDNIGERFEIWLNDNMYFIAFDDIIELGDSIGIFNMDELQLDGLKDSVKIKVDETKKQIVNLSSESLGMDSLAWMIGKEIGVDSINLNAFMKEVVGEDLSERYEKYILADLGNEYFNQVLLPGTLTDTNAGEVNGDTLRWYVSSIKFINADYTMFAESRVTNNWAYILSGFILTIAFIIPFLRKKKA